MQELVNKGVASELELKAVACVLHHCSAGFSSEEPEKRIYELLEKLGSSPEYAQLRDQLSKEEIVISYTLINGEKITQKVSLFEYSKMDGLLDGASYSDGEYQLSTRGLASLQAIDGAVEIIGGVVSCATPFTCVAGAAVATSGYDNLQAGSNTLVTGRQTKTMGAKALEALGVPSEYSEIVYATTTLGGAGTIALRSAKTGEIITTTVTAEGKVLRQAGDSAYIDVSVGKTVDGKIIRNSDGLYEVNINKTPLEAYERLNTPDLGGSGKLKPAEAASAAQLESVLGKMERYAPPSGATSGTSPDFVIMSGPNKGKTVDAMYTTDKLSQKEIDGLNKFYEKNMDSGKGKVVIQEHLNKADFVPVDFRVLTPSNQKIFNDYIKTLPKSQQDKIIIVR